MKAWRILIAAVAWLGPVLDYGLTVHDKTLVLAAFKSVEFFSYFTIVSNLLAAVALTAPLIAPGSDLARWAQASATRIALAVYLTITAVVYHTLLAGLWSPRGAWLIADTLLHTVTPALFLIDWLAWGGQGEARWSAAIKALRIPAIYGVWTLVHGALSGFYPYPFLNVAKHGYPSVLITMAAMFCGFVVVALAFTALHRARAGLAICQGAPISA